MVLCWSPLALIRRGCWLVVTQGRYYAKVIWRLFILRTDKVIFWESPYFTYVPLREEWEAVYLLVEKQGLMVITFGVVQRLHWRWQWIADRVSYVLAGECSIDWIVRGLNFDRNKEELALVGKKGKICITVKIRRDFIWITQANGYHEG